MFGWGFLLGKQPACSSLFRVEPGLTNAQAQPTHARNALVRPLATASFAVAVSQSFDGLSGALPGKTLGALLPQAGSHAAECSCRYRRDTVPVSA